MVPLPRRGTDGRVLLFGVGCPVLAQQWDELFCDETANVL